MITKSFKIGDGTYIAPCCETFRLDAGICSPLCASTNGATIDGLTVDSWDEEL